MIEFEGQPNYDARVEVSVALDSETVGTLTMTLAQWDRLRQHRRDATTSERAGLAIHVHAVGADD